MSRLDAGGERVRWGNRSRSGSISGEATRRLAGSLDFTDGLGFTRVWTLPMGLDFTDGAARHGPTRQPHWTLPMSLDFTDRAAKSHSPATLDFTDAAGMVIHRGNLGFTDYPLDFTDI